MWGQTKFCMLVWSWGSTDIIEGLSHLVISITPSYLAQVTVKTHLEKMVVKIDENKNWINS